MGDIVLADASLVVATWQVVEQVIENVAVQMAIRSLLSNLLFVLQWWPGRAIGKFIGDETATLANMEKQCYIDIAKYSHLVSL
jgi:hypothetical protein